MIESYENYRDAAKLLSSIHERTMEFLRHLRKKYHVGETEDQVRQCRARIPDHCVEKSDECPLVKGSTWHGPARTEDVQNMVEALLKNYNPEVFYENDPAQSNETSYTVNKGEAMYICLRKKSDPRQFENEETIFFVMLHECAHIANYNGWGHDTRFWTIFKFLLQEAVEAGVYHPIDYAKYPQPYCSIEVYYQPLYDDGLASLR